MTRAAIYARISDDREGTEAGVRRQEADCRALAERRGWDVAEVFADNDVSAFSGRARPAWREMLSAVRSGSVGVVVAWSNDRLYRNVPDQLDLLTALRAAGGSVATVKDGDVDPTTAEGEMRMTILASVAQFESRRKSERLRRKHEDIAAEGRWVGGGRRPYGYQVVGRPATLRSVPEEAAIVREAAGRIASGWSLQRAVADLNQRGVPTGGGERWTLSRLRTVLTNPAVAGLRVHRRTGTTTEGGWPAILTRAEHELMRVRLAPSGRSRPGARRYVLTGLAECGKCGRPMMGSGERYVCSRLSGGCGRNRIARRLLEVPVFSAILTELDREPQREAAPAPVGPAPEVEAALAELAELEGRIGRAADDYAAGLLDGEGYARATARMRDRARELNGIIAAAPRRRPTLEEAWGVGERALTNDLTPAELAADRDLVRGLVERIVVGAAAGPGRRVDPSRVRITWRE